MPKDSCLRALLRLDSSSSQFPDQLYDILDGSGFDDYVKDLEANDLLWLIGFLDEVQSSLQLEELSTELTSGPRRSEPGWNRLRKNPPQTSENLRLTQDTTIIARGIERSPPH